MSIKHKSYGCLFVRLFKTAANNNLCTILAVQFSVDFWLNWVRNWKVFWAIKAIARDERQKGWTLHWKNGPKFDPSTDFLTDYNWVKSVRMTDLQILSRLLGFCRVICLICNEIRQKYHKKRQICCISWFILAMYNSSNKKTSEDFPVRKSRLPSCSFIHIYQ